MSYSGPVRGQHVQVELPADAREHPSKPLWVTPTGEVYRRTAIGRPGSRVVCIRLTPYGNKKGHLMVRYRLDGQKHREYVHRLVLETFVGPCPVGLECCHRNGHHSDNVPGNLYWGTRSQNVQDSIRHGTFKGGSGANKGAPPV